MELTEYEKAVATLTSFQVRVLKAIENGPNEMANTWDIVLNGFAKEWKAKRSSHGALAANSYSRWVTGWLLRMVITP